MVAPPVASTSTAGPGDLADSLPGSRPQLSLPKAHGLFVDLTGAQIVDDNGTESPGQERDIYLPKHTEYISHIALDIGGSLAKVVYFTRLPARAGVFRGTGASRGTKATSPPPRRQGATTPRKGSSESLSQPQPNGYLDPKALDGSKPINPALSASVGKHVKRRSSTADLPGGRLNFVKFETDKLDDCIEYLATLISSSSVTNGISVDQMKKSVQIIATGGGAHLFYERLQAELGVRVHREEEMDCLITGLTFITEIPDEVFSFSDQLVDAISHPHMFSPGRASIPIEPLEPPELDSAEPLPRPSPNPPQYSLVFESNPMPQFPCLLVNIGSGVSVIRVDEDGKFERVSGTSLGGGTLWGILSMLTGAQSFDEMLALSESGDNSTVDLLVGDIYGTDIASLGLKSSTIASSFGKVFRKDQRGKAQRPEDISRSLLYAISNNIGQIAYMNAEKYNLDRIYFGGCFIRGHAATISTLAYAIRFWSKGTKRALFLRHEGFLGAIGAWLKNLDPINGQAL